MNPIKVVLLLYLLSVGVLAREEVAESEAAAGPNSEQTDYESDTENQSTQPPPAALNAEPNRSVSEIPIGSDPRLRFHESPRPKTALSWYNRILVPKFTRNCQGSENVALSKHCAKYLWCVSRYFGAERTCNGGLLFDAVTKTCIQENLVNCSIY